jgi:hypothetical protein
MRPAEDGERTDPAVDGRAIAGRWLVRGIASDGAGEMRRYCVFDCSRWRLLRSSRRLMCWSVFVRISRLDGEALSAEESSPLLAALGDRSAGIEVVLRAAGATELEFVYGLGGVRTMCARSERARLTATASGLRAPV